MSNPWFNDEQLGGHSDRAPEPLPSVPPEHTYSFGVCIRCGHDSTMQAKPCVPPEEPRKCPTCGTKLIPAAQAFSEIREHIVPEEPPAELAQAIEDFGKAYWRMEEEQFNGDSEYRDARAALLALFDRQREELEGALNDADARGIARLDRIASLSAQLERLKAEQITVEEAQEILIDANYPVAVAPVRSLGERKKTRDAGLAKLRRLSQSDQ